jgi:large subunit ribosomal protein L10
MALTKAKKGEILKGLKDSIGKQKSIAFTSITGLKVKDLSELRKQMRKNDCELKVAKKTLISKALQSEKLEFDVKKLAGEVAVGFSYKDEILPFKILGDFAKSHEHLKVLGGILDKEAVDMQKALVLSELPTKEELIIRLMFNALKGNLRNLVYALSQIRDKQSTN